MKFYEIAFGSVKDRNIIVNSSQLRTYFAQAKKERKELYRSVYYYDDKIIEHFMNRKSVRGYIGACGLDRIIFDFDRGTMTDEALLLHVRNYLQQFMDDWRMPKECIEAWYSGTGYHIILPEFFKFTPSPKLPEVVKATIAKHFPDLDLSIYDPLSIIRMRNTINPKVQRFKVQLTLHELYHLSAAEIIKISQSNRVLPASEPCDPDEIPNYNDRIVYPSNQVATTNNKGNFLTNKITCIQKLFLQGPKKGNRHQSMLRISSSWRRGGMPEPAIIASLKAWAPDMDEYEIEKIVRNTFEANNNDGYNFGCTDEIMRKFCDERCVYFKNKDLVPVTKTHIDMEKNFVNFIRSDFKTKSIDLMKLLKVPNRSHNIIPGENVLCFGDGGLGKTAFAQNIALRANNLRVLYGNFEFPTDLLYRRFVQIKNEMSKAEVIEHYQFNDNSLSKGLEHLKIVDDSIDIKGLYQIIESYEPGLVILDTLMKIRTGDRNDYAKSVTLSNLFKTLATKYKMIVIAINHIPKTVSGSSKKLTQHSGKGSGDLENMSDHVIMIEGNSNNDNRTISAGKARDEAKFQLPFKYDWNTFTYKYIGI